jgi:hypothetical protein
MSLGWPGRRTEAQRPGEPEREGVPPWQESVARVNVSRAAEGAPYRLAYGGLSAIYLGRLVFRNGARKRVAIKCPRQPMTDDVAYRTQECIEALTAAGVRLPKMLVYRFPGGPWAIVAQLFGSRRRGSKLDQPNRYFRHLDGATRTEAIAQLTCVANAGYVPSLDLFVTLEGSPLRIVPIDLDLIFRDASLERRVKGLLRCAMQITDARDERRGLLRTAQISAAPDVRSVLDRELDDPKSAFRWYWDDAGGA